MYWTRNLSFFSDPYLFNVLSFYICKKIVDNLILALQNRSCVEGKTFQELSESLAVLQPYQGLCSTLKLLTIHRTQILAKLELFGTHKWAYFQNKIKYSDFWLLLLHQGSSGDLSDSLKRTVFSGFIIICIFIISVLLKKPVDLNYNLIIIYCLSGIRHSQPVPVL